LRRIHENGAENLQVAGAEFSVFLHRFLTTLLRPLIDAVQLNPNDVVQCFIQSPLTAFILQLRGILVMEYLFIQISYSYV